MQRFDSPNDFVQSLDLQALTSLRSDQGPVFSLYLDLRPEKSVEGSLLTRFESLLSQATQQKKLDQADPALREQWNREAARLRAWLEELPSLQEGGLAVFSSLAADLWQPVLLPAPVPDRLTVLDQADARPLAILLDEFKRSLVVLIDDNMARLVEVFLGSAKELDRIEVVPVTGGGWVEEGVLQYAQAVAGRAQTIWFERGCERLVTGGSGDTLETLREVLAPPLRQNLAGELPIPPQTDLQQILNMVQEITAEEERRLEAERVEELTSSARNGDRAVMGLEQTLLAVRSKKVRMLVVDEDFHQPGGECPNCGFLDDGDETVCLLCGMALRPVPDVIEVALKRVLDQGGEIEVLRSPDYCHALEAEGSIGVLLRKEVPPEKETANQMPLEKHGEVNRDAIHDEAIQESFPGSDPPSHTIEGPPSES